MSFTVVFYNNTSANNTIKKSITQTASYDCTLREESSIVSPTVTIAADSISGNYAYISNFGRYYYITDIVSLRTGLWRVTMKSDPLMSAQSAILSCPCVLKRSTENYNLYLPDTLWTSESRRIVTTQPFSAGLSNSQSCILLTAGPGGE